MRMAVVYYFKLKVSLIFLNNRFPNYREDHKDIYTMKIHLVKKFMILIWYENLVLYCKNLIKSKCFDSKKNRLVI